MKALLCMGCLFWMIGDPVGAPTTSCEHAVYTWPLGYGIANQERNATTVTLDIGDVTYADGPLDYSAMAFIGTTASYADLAVAYSTRLYSIMVNDFSVQMYVYLTSYDSNGTIFTYRSDGWNTAQNNKSQILGFSAHLEFGDIVITYDHFASKLYDTNLQPFKWYHFIFERDCSNSKTTIYIDRTISIQLTVSNDLYDIITDFPGVLRVGGSFDQSGQPLEGRVACLQIVPGKEPFPCIDHDAICQASAWPLAITGSQTNVNIVNDGCMRFTMTNTNVEFGSSADVIDTMVVESVSTCALLCSKTNGCALFSVERFTLPYYRCTIAINTTNTAPAQDSILYKLV